MSGNTPFRRLRKVSGVMSTDRKIGCTRFKEKENKKDREKNEKQASLERLLMPIELPFP
jgi:hypothetical protein